MIESTKLSRKTIQQRRLERKAVKRNNRKNKIVRHCCKECGKPKHYVCLDHNSYRRKSFFKRILKRIRYNTRKVYFGLAVKFGLAVNK